jgi:hypothetical protein
MTIFFIYAPILVCDIRTSFINQDGPGFNSINARLLDDLGQDADIRGQPKGRQVVERKEGLSAELPTELSPSGPRPRSSGAGLQEAFRRVMISRTRSRT